MASAGAMEESNVEKCLSVLRSAESDNERFAALLLVTKVVKSEDCSEETRKQIFDAIGFKFLKRLIQSRQAPEGCPPNTYRSIASTILACFCTDPNLVVHPELLSFIPVFKEIICVDPSPSSEDEPRDDTDCHLIDDTYQCLLAVANEPEGRQALLNNKTTLVLSQTIAHEHYGHENALQVLLMLLHHCGSATWQGYLTSVDNVLIKYAKQFAESQDLGKFKVCDLLATLCVSLTGVRFGQVLPEWSQFVLKGVRDILQSRVGAEQRSSALHLASAMIECLGLRWIMGNDQLPVEDGRKFLLLLVHLTCIEIRMTLENCSHEQINDKAGLLTTCYALLEHIINYMTEGPTLNLDDKRFKQLHSAMVGAFNAVIHFLTDLSANREHKIGQLLEYSTVRVLSAWLAEETSALKDEVYKLLPYLLQTCRENFETVKSSVPTQSTPDQPDFSTTVDLLRFLLPSLCHFSSEDNSRAILVENKGHVLLGEYMQFLWEQHNRTRHKDYKIAMITICGIFLNFGIFEHRMVAQNPVFHNLLKFFASVLPILAYDHTNLMLVGNFTVLSMMMIRLQSKNLDIPQSDCESLFNAVIHFQSGAHVSGDPERGLILADDYRGLWGQLSDLWFLGMQALASCIERFAYLPHLILKSGWVPSLLKHLSDAKDSNVDRDVAVAYGAFLSDLTAKKGLARQVVIEKGGRAIADLYKMESLQRLLSQS